jgi:cell shape-determining protein MreC
VIGTVDELEKSGNAYKRIVVKPALDFRSLEAVLVVTQTGTDAAERSHE